MPASCPRLAPALPPLRPLACALRTTLFVMMGGPALALAQAATPSATGATAPPSADVARLPALTITAPTSGETEGSGSYAPSVQRSATGLSLTARETPQSVSVVTRQQIEDEGLQDTADILVAAPGISASRSDSNRWAFSSRGFAIDSFRFDGLNSPILSLWNYGATDMDSAIYDRVEIVRGATGLMTGAGNPSASINFVRKRPQRDFAASALVSVGRWRNVRAEADISTPLTEDGRVRARVVAALREGDSNVSFLDTHRRTLYGVVTADLTPATQVTASVEYQRSLSHGFGSGFPLFYSDGSRTAFDRSVSNNTPWARQDTDSTTAFLDLTHRFANDWQARVAYSHNWGSYRMKQVFRGGYPDRVTGLGMTDTFANYDGKRRRNDVHVTLGGPFELLGRRHELSLGWMRVSDHSDIQRYVPLTPLPVGGSYFNWQDATLAEPTWSDTLSPADDLRLRQDGAYAVGRFALAEPLHLILGARVSRWHTQQVYFGSQRDYKITREVTPYAGLVWDITSAYSAYTSYTDIFQPQNARTPSGDLLDPVTGRSYEVGLKGSFLDERLNGSVALFQTRQDNLAQAIPGETVVGMPNVQAYRSVSGAKVRGVDIEVNGTLAEGWNLSASLTHFKAEDADGNPISTGQPRTLIKLFTAYQLPGQWHRLTLGGGVNWQSRIYQNAASPRGQVEVGQGAYAVANVMARYQFSRQLSAALHVNNLFDKTYYQQIGFYSQGWYGTPRNVMLTLRAQY